MKAKDLIMPRNWAKRLQGDGMNVKTNSNMTQEEKFIKRACEWLECNATCYLNSISASDIPTSSSTPRYIGAWLETDRLIEDFKKAMQL